MIVEWLAPISAMVFSARLLLIQVRQGWRGAENALKLLAGALTCYVMLWFGLEATTSLGYSASIAMVTSWSMKTINSNCLMTLNARIFRWMPSPQQNMIPLH